MHQTAVLWSGAVLMDERSLQTSDTGVNIRYKGFKEITKGTERYGKDSDHWRQPIAGGTVKWYFERRIWDWYRADGGGRVWACAGGELLSDSAGCCYAGNGRFYTVEDPAGRE